MQLGNGNESSVGSEVNLQCPEQLRVYRRANWGFDLLEPSQLGCL